MKNIVIFLSDQQRYDTLASAKVFNNVMPNLDNIAKNGTSFENCYTVNPLCGPARASLQTGKYPTESGNFKNGKTLKFNHNLLAVQLKNAGYDTAYIGKWHLYKNRLFKNSVPFEDRNGYDYWRTSNLLEFTSTPYSGYVFGNDNEKIYFDKYRSDFLCDLALEYLDTRTKEKPFMLFLSQLEPHHQNLSRAFFAKKGTREKFLKEKIPKDLINKKGDYNKFLPDYLGACNNLDDNVGQIINKLKEKDLFEDTLFIYTSDHGCHFKTRNGEYKRSCHDASIKVPLVITGEGFLNKGLRQELVSIMDVTATALDYAGIKIPKDYRGESLKALINGGIKERESVFIQISESQRGRAIRTKDFKYSVKAKFNINFKKSAKVYVEDFLYDLKIDPHENNNLINNNEYQNIKIQLNNKLLEHIKNVENETPKIIPKKVKIS